MEQYEVNRFFVKPTKSEDRKEAKDNYVVCVNSNTKKRLDLGKFAVVSTCCEEIKQTLHVHCQVILDSTLLNNEVKLDETLRTALAFPCEYVDYAKHTVEIYPLDLTLLQLLNEYISRLLGRRYLFFRVCRADSLDMDKTYARVNLESIKLLGTTEGNNLILENAIKNENNRYTLKKISLQVYELTPEIQKVRDGLQRRYPYRFPSLEKVLPVEQDIWPILFDLYVREELNLEVLDPLKVRRDLLSIFLREFREFGILFFLTSLTITTLLPNNQMTWKLLALISSFIVSLSLTLINIKERVK
ncbi:hypothetical protein [Methanomethylovorans hollandica]|uniref:hypothetical protein n=1 Tax=Methanomethylovorans hollandica TaxID=101192 RepID=UPI0012EAB569|nr:hypothetical protein [Methanomethylovorans hollandica]